MPTTLALPCFGLRHHFRALCTKYPGLHRTQSTKAVDVVFDKVVEKAINARFAVAFMKFKELNINAKEKLAIRNTLKVTEARVGKQGITASIDKKGKDEKRKAVGAGEKSNKVKALKKSKKVVQLPKPTAEEARAAREQRRMHLIN